jgi:hypothetical protein
MAAVGMRPSEYKRSIEQSTLKSSDAIGDARFMKVGTWHGNKIHFISAAYKTHRGIYPICGAGHSHTKGSNKSYRMVSQKLAVTCERCLKMAHEAEVRDWLKFMESEH